MSLEFSLEGDGWQDSQAKMRNLGFISGQGEGSAEF